MEQPESDLEKRERLRRKLQEAAIEYQEDPNKGWAQISFFARKNDTGEIQVWRQEPRQVAAVMETEVTFVEGDTFSVEFIEDVVLLEKTNDQVV